MNKIVLIGNLTRDPELSVSNNGLPYCRFSIAVQRRYPNSEGVKEADFFSIVAWRGLAENCHKFLKKGSKVAVAGSVQIRNYETSSGEKRTAVDVLADDVEFVGARVNSESSEDVPQAPKQSNEEANITLEPVDDGDLPF